MKKENYNLSPSFGESYAFSKTNAYSFKPNQVKFTNTRSVSIKLKFGTFLDIFVCICLHVLIGATKRLCSDQ